MSDTATTSTSTLPPPASAATSGTPAAPAATTPSAFSIGKSFIKQYYEVLATCPDNITRFYKPKSSIISHSFEPSVPAAPETPSTDTIGVLFHWAGSASAGICVDFCNGTIDAQETINGGIILVVTGHMTLPSTTAGDDDDVVDVDVNPSPPRQFVHTFFLNNSAPAGRKKNFYVHNDILRFISTSDVQDQEDTVQAQVPATTTTTASSDGANDLSTPTAPPQDKPLPTENDTKEASLTVEASTTTTIEEVVVPMPSAVSQNKVQILDEKADKKDGDKKQTIPSNDSNNKSPTKKNDTKSEKSKQSKKSDENGKNYKKKDKESTTTTTSSAATASESKSNKADKKKNTTTTNTNNTTSSSTNHNNDSSDQQPSKDEKKSKKKSRSRSRKKGSRSTSPSDVGKNGGSKSGKNDDSSSSSKPKTPGSWASLVARSGGSSKPSPAAAAAASVASQMTESTKPEQSDKSKSTTSSTNNNDTPASIPPTTTTTTTTNANNNNNQDNNNNNSNSNPPKEQKSSSKANASSVAQRTPEATLFLKNIPDRTKEIEIRSMFEPYATSLNKKILGITLKASSGFCFVDFDAKVVVDTILKEVDELKAKTKQKDGSGSSGEKKAGVDGNKFVLHGKLLDVGRKVPNEKNGGGRGHSFRSASPGNNAYQKSRHHRRNSPRGGNRSGRQHGHQDKKS